MTDRLTCAIVDEHDLVARFVAERLSDEAADALEEHCVICERCWGELRLALRVSAAGHVEPDAREDRTQTRRSTFKYLPWLAVAAALLLTVGVVRWGRQAPPASVERGTTERLPVTVTQATDGGTRLEWAPIEGAARYVVKVATGDGRLVTSREVTETTTTLGDIPTTVGANGALVTVDAYDALGNRLASSDATPLP